MDNVSVSTGTQSQITDEIRGISKEIGFKDWEYVFATLRWMRRNLKSIAKSEGWREKFRSRTASQMILDRTTTGCSDVAVVFCALARAGGIPALYCEYPYLSWMTSTENSSFSNHCVAKIQIGDRWFWVDPVRCTVSGEGTEPSQVAGGIEYVFFAEGHDSWDIGIKSWDEYKAKYLEFRNQWQKGHSIKAA